MRASQKNGPSSKEGMEELDLFERYFSFPINQ